MTKINTYEGNSFRVTRTYSTSTTLAAYGVTFTMMQNKDDYTALVSVTGTVTGQGVVFDIPPQTLSKGVYYFEVTAETTTQKVTLEQDRIIVRESIVYVS